MEAVFWNIASCSVRSGYFARRKGYKSRIIIYSNGSYCELGVEEVDRYLIADISYSCRILIDIHTRNYMQPSTLDCQHCSSGEIVLIGWLKFFTTSLKYVKPNVDGNVAIFGSMKMVNI